ncbi:hypothetical protein FC756_14665 [Lysinibacillus mangiferihumi]|uniref:DNA-binding protein n=1 Tax=Lysinibacillus mangiferihumi TaxID=1130819 RepID=A0A4U2YZJ1_9BACI|nr:hypothetical protein [Lysinibacillus mangiferihumi]TKI66665.1 hypothetical protein FC756_14665 [Lysinibacillus mangiferihumi]
MNLTIDELKEALLNAELADLFQKAYKQGVEDCRESMRFELSLPSNLKKEHVAQIFQCELPTVEKIIRMDGFPKCHALTARYPRDKVLEWRDKNVMYMNSRLGIYVSENESLRLLRA